MSSQVNMTSSEDILNIWIKSRANLYIEIFADNSTDTPLIGKELETIKDSFNFESDLYRQPSFLKIREDCTRNLKFLDGKNLTKKWDEAILGELLKAKLISPAAKNFAEGVLATERRSRLNTAAFTNYYKPRFDDCLLYGDIDDKVYQLYWGFFNLGSNIFSTGDLLQVKNGILTETDFIALHYKIENAINSIVSCLSENKIGDPDSLAVLVAALRKSERRTKKRQTRSSKYAEIISTAIDRGEISKKYRAQLESAFDFRSKVFDSGNLADYRHHYFSDTENKHLDFDLKFDRLILFNLADAGLITHDMAQKFLTLITTHSPETKANEARKWLAEKKQEKEKEEEDRRKSEAMLREKVKMEQRGELCSNCKAQVSSSAYTCPSCGHPLRFASTRAGLGCLGWALLFIVVPVLVLMFLL